MCREKYVGLDVQQSTISAAVMDAGGKLPMECVLETKAGTIVEFIRGLQGTLWLTFEEGTSAAWFARSTKTLRQPAGGVRSAQECTPTGGQQE